MRFRTSANRLSHLTHSALKTNKHGLRNNAVTDIEFLNLADLCHRTSVS